MFYESLFDYAIFYQSMCGLYMFTNPCFVNPVHV